MLPPGLLQHTFDITIQAPGAATFAEPAQITLPNVFNAPPGTKLNLLSFDHTTGRLVIDGTATVSADGQSATTDPDNGVTHPGWHGMTPPGSPTDPPCPPNNNPKSAVAPVPDIPKSGDHFLSATNSSVTLRFANKARKPSGQAGVCSSVTPMVVTMTISDTADEFLEGIRSHSFTLTPGASQEVTVSAKDILASLPKIARNRLYGATIDVNAFRSDDLATAIATSKLNIYRFYDVSDTSPNDGRIQIPLTSVDQTINAAPATLSDMKTILNNKVSGYDYYSWLSTPVLLWIGRFAYATCRCNSFEGRRILARLRHNGAGRGR
jgi:hypothetical protein